MSAPGNEIELFYVVDKTEDYERRLADNKSKRVRLVNQLSQLASYLGMKERFSDFRGTQTTDCFFGALAP